MQIFDEKKITIKGNDQKIHMVLAQIYLIEIKLLVIEFYKEIEINEWTIDDTYQELLD